MRLEPEHRAPLLEILAVLAPFKAEHFGKVRVGGDRDGGYVLLDDLGPVNLALSLGVGPDVSWDEALAARGVPVLQFDHTVAAPPRAHPLFRFERKRVVIHESSETERAFASILENARGRQVLLKMDIEGDEWPVLAALEPELLRDCRQIIIEFHDLLRVRDPAWRETAHRALATLGKNHGVVHVHGNNLSEHIWAGGRWLPNSLEVTWAHRNLYELRPTDETFPGPYDRKNNPFFPDFHLGPFRFGPRAPENRQRVACREMT